MKYYAGIGSRETPTEIGELMSMIATILETMKYALRSGGADGADSFFENGVVYKENKEIYLPWKGFNNNDSNLYTITEESMELAKKFHPNFNGLSMGAKKLMARNGYQVLGYDLKTPVDFIVCWTKDAKKTGGTSQAMRIAESCGIKIYNLASRDDMRQFFVNFDIKLDNQLF